MSRKSALETSASARVQPDVGAAPLHTGQMADALGDSASTESLERLKRATQHPVDLVTLAVKSLWDGKEAPPAYLQRLGLDEATSFKAMFIRKLFAGNL